MHKYTESVMRAGISGLLLISMLSAAHAEICAPSCGAANTTTEGQKVKNPINCYQYYICSDVDGDGAFELSDDPLDCPEGTYFNETRGCITIPTNGTYCKLCNPCTVNCIEPGTFLPDPYSCHNYYICLANDLKDSILTACPQGEMFDYIKLQCVNAADATCYEFCDPCKPYCVEEGRIPNPFDCNSYYYCVPPDQYATFHCENGFYFDSTFGNCTMGTCADDCYV